MTLRKPTRLQVILYCIIILPLLALCAKEAWQYNQSAVAETSEAYEPALHVSQQMWDTYAAWLGHAKVQTSLDPGQTGGAFLLEGDTPAKQDLIQRFNLTPRPAGSYHIPRKFVHFDRKLEGATVYGTDRTFRIQMPINADDPAGEHSEYLGINILELTTGEPIVVLDSGEETGDAVLVEPIHPELVKSSAEIYALRMHGFRDGDGAGTHHLDMAPVLAALTLALVLFGAIGIFCAATQLLLFGWPRGLTAWLVWFLAPLVADQLYSPGLAMAANSLFFSALLLLPALIVRTILRRIKRA